MNRTVVAPVNKRGKISCSFGGCNSDGRYASISFVSFPKPCFRVKNSLVYSNKRHTTKCPICQKCERWVTLCKKTDGSLSTVNDVNKNTYVCSMHFVDRQPSELFPDPLPAEEVLKIRRSKRNRVQKGKSQLAFSGQRAQNEIANCFDLTNTNESANKPPLDQNEKVLRNILQPNKKTQSAPRPDSDCEFDPLDLNNLLLSTTSIFQGMCKELEMTSKMNENIDYLNLDKERITLTAAGGQNEKSLQVFMVNKHPLHPDETSLSDTTDKLDQMITDVENTVMVDNDDLSRISESSSIGTQTDNRTLEMENKQLKSEIASLKMRISSLQKQMMRQDVPRLLFVTSESNLR
ncbi:hypothetical protein JTB14_011836 [Gonioctena quinquepunctata]|nr:hypothetical protein JTB14_011836 [Gonioctena quinquepunctata]